MDIITYILAKNSSKKYTDTAIAAIAKGFTYKGTVATVSDLPTSGNKKGDCWTVTEDGSEWLWTSDETSGDYWIELGSSQYTVTIMD